MSIVTTPSVEEISLERLLAEQATVFSHELLRVANDAPDGQVLRLAELFVLEQGRAFLRNALQQVLQSQATSCEKKTGQPAPVNAENVGIIKADHHSNS